MKTLCVYGKFVILDELYLKFGLDVGLCLISRVILLIVGISIGGGIVGGGGGGGDIDGRLSRIVFREDVSD